MFPTACTSGAAPWASIELYLRHKRKCLIRNYSAEWEPEMLLYQRYNLILAHGAAPEVQAVGKFKKKMKPR